MRAFLRGFAFAGRGVWAAVKSERNFRFHLCAAVYVYVFSLFYSLTAAEYALLTLVVAAVLALELVNSALERAVDVASPHKNGAAGTAKDMAAGAVLVASVAAAVCGLLLFWRPAVFEQIFAYFAARPWLLAVLAATLAASALFVFRFGEKKAGAGKTERKDS